MALLLFLMLICFETISSSSDFHNGKSKFQSSHKAPFVTSHQEATEDLSDAEDELYQSTRNEWAHTELHSGDKKPTDEEESEMDESEIDASRVKTDQSSSGKLNPKEGVDSKTRKVDSEIDTPSAKLIHPPTPASSEMKSIEKNKTSSKINSTKVTKNESSTSTSSKINSTKVTKNESSTSTSSRIDTSKVKKNQSPTSTSSKIDTTKVTRNQSPTSRAMASTQPTIASRNKPMEETPMTDPKTPNVPVLALLVVAVSVLVPIGIIIAVVIVWRRKSSLCRCIDNEEFSTNGIRTININSRENPAVVSYIRRSEDDGPVQTGNNIYSDIDLTAQVSSSSNQATTITDALQPPATPAYGQPVVNNPVYAELDPMFTTNAITTAAKSSSDCQTTVRQEPSQHGPVYATLEPVQCATVSVYALAREPETTEI